MMKELHFTLKLNEPLVLMQNTKTGQNTEVLTYIPGSIFRGIVAGYLFRNEAEMNIINDNHGSNVSAVLSRFRNDIIFSKKVCFGDAHLSINNTRSLPIPFSFYKEKSGEQIKNFHSLKQEDFNKKQKQIRKGYFISNKNEITIKNVATNSRMKSSRNRDTRSSKEGGLFIYPFIERLQSFHFSVVINQDDENNTIEKIIEEVFHQKTKRLGKSKSAEFGGDAYFEYKQTEEINTNDKITTQYIFAESNLCFLNEYGDFTVTPTLSQLTGSNTENIDIDWEKSQIRYRKYYPYNNHRKNWDAERLIIEKGSLFVLTKKIDIKNDFINKGIGCFVNEGFGRVRTNLSIFDEDTVKLSQTKTNTDETKDTKKIKDSPLLKILQQKKTYKENIDKAKELANNGTIKFSKSITSSQWSRVYNACVGITDPKELEKKLFNNDNAICTSGARNPWKRDENKLRDILTDLKNKEKENTISIFKFFSKLMIAKSKNTK